MWVIRSKEWIERKKAKKQQQQICRIGVNNFSNPIKLWSVVFCFVIAIFLHANLWYERLLFWMVYASSITDPSQTKIYQNWFYLSKQITHFHSIAISLIHHFYFCHDVLPKEHSKEQNRKIEIAVNICHIVATPVRYTILKILYKVKHILYKI